MRISELIKRVNVLESVGIDGESEVTFVTSDSRRCQKGCMFVCLRGENDDGHRYIAEAVKAGAVCVVAEKNAPESCGTSYIITDDARKADAFIQSAYYGDPSDSMSMIAVTGTNGKTTTARMLYDIFRYNGEKCGLIGTAGNYVGDTFYEASMTTPGTEELFMLLARMRDGGCTRCVMEVSSHALAYGKVLPVLYDVGVFLNLSPEHLDFHLDMKSYARAKSLLFSQCKTALVNSDDSYAGYMMNLAGKTLTYSIAAAGSDYYADDIKTDPRSGSSYRINGIPVRIPLPGAFNLFDSFAAICAAAQAGVGIKSAIASAASFSGVSGRFECVIGAPAPFSVYIDYAHTPKALGSVLRLSRTMTKGKLTVLFGCGGDRDKSKRPVMGSIACDLADKVIITSDNCRNEDRSGIIRQIIAGTHGEVTVIPIRADAIRYAVMTAVPDEFILVAGKGHENYEIDSNGKHAFNEKKVILDAYSEYFGAE